MQSNNAAFVLVGLGNPGDQYVNTRHNVGFDLLDRLADQHNLHFKFEKRFNAELVHYQQQQHRVYLLKPMTFMNRSGAAIAALLQYYQLSIEQIMVVHDDLDLDPGQVKVKKGGGHGGHNGLRDTISAMSSKEFLRLRLGIGHPGHRDQVVHYVLHGMSKTDISLIDAAIDDSIQALDAIISGDLQAAMNNLHSRKI